MITLNDYNVSLNDYNLAGDGAGFLGGSTVGQQELLKAMQAGQITGRDTTGIPLTQEPLKVESLEKTLKLLEFRAKDIRLFNALPKLTAYNTVEEFLQLISYGAQRGGFYDEGELSDVEDSKYMRRAEYVKYMQVTGEVTIQAQMVRSYVDAWTQEVKNKMMWVTRLANAYLTKGDADIVPQQFNSLYKQHASVGVGSEYLYPTFEDYYKDEVVIDLRGGTLTQEELEDGGVVIDKNYGDIDGLYAPTRVISNLSKDYYQRQRILLGGNTDQKFNGNAVPKFITTTLGDVSLNPDKFMATDGPKISTTPADSVKAPAAPASLAAALVTDTLAKFTTPEAGNVYYAVAALNRYGESQLTIYNTAVAVAVGSSVDLTITAGTSAIAPTGYTIYRTEVTTAGSPTGLQFHPIFRVSVAQVANGFNGGAAGVVRDRGYFMPNTDQAFATSISDEVLSFKQLAPISKLDLAVVSMSRRFITFLFGTPQLYAPKKVVRYINIGRRYIQAA